MSINVIANHINTSQQNIGIVLSKDSVDILQRLKKIDSSCFFYSDKKLVNKLKTIEPLELTNILKCFFMEMLQEDRIKDPVKFLDRLTTMIPLTKLEEAVKDDMSGALEKANEMFAEAKLYLQMTQESHFPNFRAYFSSIIEGIMAVIETIITTFGIGDVFKPAESEMQASSKTQKIMMLFSYISMFAAIIPVIGAAASGLIISGTFLVISALSVIWPSIKPKTTHLPANAENWTKQIQAGAFVAQGRKESLDQIANILKINRHAILVGPSRVGKSLTAKAFAQAIARGDYPELNGKVVFRINTTELLSQQILIFDGEDSILNKISKTMGRHRNDIILVLDEIHMACKNNEKIADQLKTLLDEGGEFPHVIGITTEEEYSLHVKDNNAFSLRFDKVDIKNTSRDETLRILGETLLKSHSKPIVKEGLIDYVYDKSCEIENAPQPATAIKLLKRCINRTEKTQLSQTEQKIIELSNKILSFRTVSAASHQRKNDAKIQINELEKQKKALQETLRKEKNDLDKLFKSKDLLNRVTKETYSTVLKIASVSQQCLNPKNENQLKLFLLLHAFLSRSLESHITEKSEALGVKAIIDEALVDEVVMS